MPDNKESIIPEEVLKNPDLLMHAGAFSVFLEKHRDDRDPPNVTPKGLMYYKEILCLDEEIEVAKSMISHLKEGGKDYTRFSKKVETFENYKNKLIDKLHQEIIPESKEL